MVEDFLLTKLQVGIPVEYEKQLEQLLQQVTTLDVCAEPSSLGLCHGEKGCHEMERFALDIPTDCPCEALFIVVSLAATFGQHGPRRDIVPTKRCLKL